MNIRELFVSLGLDVDESSFAKGQLAADAIKASLNAVADAAKSAFAAFAKSGQEAEKLQILETATGMSVETLQELDFAAKLTGTSIDSLRVSLVQLSGRALEALRDPSRNAGFAFQRLGIAASGADGKVRPINDLFLDIVKNIDKVQGGERLGLIRELFGRGSAQVMLSLLKNGEAGLQALAKRAHLMNFVLGKESVEALADFDDQLDLVGLGFEAIRKQIVVSMLPSVRKLTNLFMDFVMRLQGPMNRGLFIMEGKWRALAVVLGSIVLAAVMALSRAFTGMLVKLAIMHAPIIVLGLLIAVVIIIVQDLWVALRGGDSVLGHLAKKLGEFYAKFSKDVQGSWWVPWEIKRAIALLEDLEGAFLRIQRLIVGGAAAVHPLLGAAAGGMFRGMDTFGTARTLLAPAAPETAFRGLPPSTGPRMPIPVPGMRQAPVVHQTVNVEVKTEPGADPWAVASAFNRKLFQANQQLVRETAEQLEVAGP